MTALLSLEMIITALLARWWIASIKVEVVNERRAFFLLGSLYNTTGQMSTFAALLDNQPRASCQLPVPSKRGMDEVLLRLAHHLLEEIRRDWLETWVAVFSRLNHMAHGWALEHCDCGVSDPFEIAAETLLSCSVRASSIYREHVRKGGGEETMRLDLIIGREGSLGRQQIPTFYRYLVQG